MLIELGYFIFLLPGDWHNTSSYIYKSTKQNVALTISFGKTRDAITLEDFVTQRRQELSDTMKDTIEFQSQQQSTIGPSIGQINTID